MISEQGDERRFVVESSTDSNENGLVALYIPVWWTLAGLGSGLLFGIVASEAGWAERVSTITGPIGSLWLRGLQMTIIPLVAALLVLGVSRLVDAARAGAIAKRMLGLVFAFLIAGGAATVILMPVLLDIIPVPQAAEALLIDAGNSSENNGRLPDPTDFLTSLIAPNIFAAAVETAMLPLTLFFVLFAIALSHIPARQRAMMLSFFLALGNTMLVIIGWVLMLAPIGVFALATGVAAKAGGGAFTVLLHYILVVSAMGLVVFLLAYLLAACAAKTPLHRFARDALPAQTVAVSTQSSLASLPAMLASARRMNISEDVAEFVLPLAVAIFRATSPAMNLAVALYIAHVAGIAIPPLALAAGVLVAVIISVGSVSLPGTISFVISIGPIAAAMGVPTAPLALLVAVEMIPDIMRTLSNVTANLAVASTVDRPSKKEPEEDT